MKQASNDDMLTRVVALAGTSLILLLFARLLLHVPAPGARQVAAPATIQVSFLPRTPVAEQPQASTPPPAVAAHARAHPPAVRAAPPPTVVAAPVAQPAQAAQAQSEVYMRDGRVRMGTVVDPLDPGHPAVPPGMADARALDKAKRVLERPNPIDYHETRFEKDWKSDGTLGDVAVQSLNRGAKKLNTMIWGEETQQAKARPPPDVRFNPALAENRADLGSEATGDAYKAAPIAHEDLPDLKGSASRRIRAALAELQELSPQCDAARRQAWLAPVRTHLGDLERAEHALNNGADPVMAAQMLPRQADSAYDLARRALWYARRQLTQCSG